MSEASRRRGGPTTPVADSGQGVAPHPSVSAAAGRRGEGQEGDDAGHGNGNARRAQVDWRGTRLLTVADRYVPGSNAVLVVLHPTACGVESGHHLTHRLGQQAMRRVLRAVGGTCPPTSALDDAVVEAGLGIVTVVKRPAGRERDLEPGDVDHGRRLLLPELAARGVDVAVCPFEPAARALAGRPLTPGVHEVGSLRVVRLAGPFAPAAERDQLLHSVRELVRGGRAGGG